MNKLIIILGLLALNACLNGKEVRMEEKKPILNEAIKFNGDYNSRQNAFEKLTKAFQEIGI
ncbi:MAG: hypothetical protein PHF29_10365, partial [Candidatus Riflebacteria bacterium]|nr:hypothetical protein [Candidatus Riflebacteria bacterium]